MKTDDPRLEKSRKEAVERVNRVNEMIVIVLKNHLVVEQFMDEFLVASGKKPKGSFADKAQHCENLKPPEFDPPVWKVLTTANQLRNKIAHKLDQAEIKAKMDELRAAYLAALSDQQRPHAEKLDDPHMAAAAFELCAAYIVAATDGVRTAKQSYPGKAISPDRTQQHPRCPINLPELRLAIPERGAKHSSGTAN